MSPELTKIIDALALTEEALSTFTYERGLGGEFRPPVITIPTWVWSQVAIAARNWRDFTADGVGDESEEEQEDGEIDQHARAFRGVLGFDETLDYRPDGERFIPAVLQIETSIWHDIAMLAHMQDAEWARQEKYRPSWISPDGDFRPRLPNSGPK